MSTIPAAKLALVAGLQAHPALSAVQVSYGPPFPAPQRELICVMGAEGEQEWTAMGVGTDTRQETYDLVVLISVQREGQDMAAADLRCFALYSEVESQIRYDTTLGNTVDKAYIGRFRLDQGMPTDEMSRTSQLTVFVNCTAFI